MKETYNDINKMFEETQLPQLLEAGFSKENISTKLLNISPPKECKYYNFGKIIAPCVRK